MATRIASIIFLAAMFTAAPFHTALAQVAPTLGTAQGFAVVAGDSVTNSGATVITGNLGVHAGSAVTGFPPGTVIGTIYAADPGGVALQAKSDARTAYDHLASQACDTIYGVATDIGGLTLTPGVYCFDVSAGLTGPIPLTLDAGGDPNAVWVFKTGSTLITGPNSSMKVTNGGQNCNVFWQVGSSATLDTGTTFIGNILAHTSIELLSSATLSGRALAGMAPGGGGAVTMDTNTVALNACAVPPVIPFPPTLNKAFGPEIIAAGGTSTLTITLSNPDATVATVTSLTDTLPAGVFVDGAPGTTCAGGTVTADALSVTLTGGSIPANGGSCTVTVPVISSIGGLHINSLAVGALATSNGSNEAPAVATLTVVVPTQPAPPTLSKVFSPSTIGAGGTSVLTITFVNTNNTPAILTASLIDTLPPGVVVAAVPDVPPSNTCGGTFTAIPGASTVTLSAGASIPAMGFCRVRVRVTAPVAASYFNVLLAGALVTNQGNNPAPGGATLVVLPPASVPGLSLNKTANPTTYTAVGDIIVYTYTLTNTGNVPLGGPFTVNDDKLGLITCGSETTILALGGSLICTQSYTIQAGDIGSGPTFAQGVTANINTGSWLQFTKSTQDTTITGALGVPNGVYPCWCIQDYVPNDLHNRPALLYSTIGGGLPADVADLPWNKVNYVLNHKVRGLFKSNLAFLKDVQTAIWVLLGETNPEFGISAAAKKMIHAANANPNWIPGPDDIVAVIIYSDGMRIFPGSIQESICEMKPKLKSIVNKATGSVRFGTELVQSGQVQVTVKQVR